MAAADATAESWRGGIPCIFALAPDELVTLVPPRPYCMCLPRQSLLPLAADVVRKHFEPFAPPMGAANLWFEAEGTPLRWQMPIGVLYDLLCGEEAATRHELPWRITVHFASFPTGDVLRATVREAESVLMNNLKESTFLRCGSAMPAMQLDAASQTALVAALAIATDPDAAYAQYRPVAASVDDAVNTHRAREVKEKSRVATHRIPFRACVAIDEWRQIPIDAVSPATGEEATLREALARMLPSLFGGDGADAAEAGGGDGGGGGGGGSAGGAEPKVLVQGLAVPLNVSLAWLYDACRHPDGWLYASVKLKAPAAEEEAIAQTDAAKGSTSASVPSPDSEGAAAPADSAAS